MKELFQKIDKRLVNDYPIVSFTGAVYEICTVADSEKALCFLEKQPMLGLDTETRPIFKRGQTRYVSLLQLATHKECFLFHLNRLGISQQLKALFENENISKIGLSLHDDIQALQRREPFVPASFVDLQTLVPQLGVLDQSLQKLFANFFHQRISKREQLSNWERIPLTEKQRRYAATDAWACVLIYDEYQKYMTTRRYRLIIEDDTTQPDKAQAEQL